MALPTKLLKFLALGALGVCAFAGSAFAQAAYPSKPIKVVIGFPAGSGADILGRYFARQLEAQAKQPVIVDNRPGATSNIAIRYVKGAEPDGYTILFVANSNMAGSRYLFKDTGFDTVKDFTPIASFAQITFIMVVSPKSPLNNLQDVIAHLKKKGDNLYGYTNQTALLSTELFKQMTGSPVKSVAYKTAPDSMRDLTDQQLDFMIMDGTFAAGQIRSGALKPIAVTTKVQSPSFPGVPTMQEAGLKDYEFAPWWAAYLPVGTPEPVRAKLESYFMAINAMSETPKFLETVGAISQNDTGKQADDRLKAEIPKWEPIVKAAGIEPE